MAIEKAEYENTEQPAVILSRMERLPMELIEEVMAKSEHIRDVLRLSQSCRMLSNCFKWNEHRIGASILRQQLPAYEYARFLVDAEYAVFREFQRGIFIYLHTATGKSVRINIPKAHQARWELFYVNDDIINTLCSLYEAHVFSTPSALNCLLQKPHPHYFLPGERARVVAMFYLLFGLMLPPSSPGREHIHLTVQSLNLHHLSILNEIAFWMQELHVDTEAQRFGFLTSTLWQMASLSLRPVLGFVSLATFRAFQHVVWLAQSRWWNLGYYYASEKDLSIGRAVTWSCVLDEEFWRADVARVMREEEGGAEHHAALGSNAEIR